MITPEQSVAGIVLTHPECAALFQQLRIDFCCKGEESLQVACAARQLSVTDVIDELTCVIDEHDGRIGATAVPARMSNMALVAHIVAKHHEYLRKSLPFVGPLAVKVARVHGEHNSHLPTVSAIVDALAAELLAHLDYEETVLFPAMLASNPDKALLATELARMRTEHLAVGVLLGRLRDETEEFSLPDWACTSYKTLFAELQQMELDILQHVHLENHVLAPRFVA